MNPNPAEQVQDLLNKEQQLLAQRGAAVEHLSNIDSDLSKVRAILSGVQLGLKIAPEPASGADTPVEAS